ncbi:hypothetical protein AAC387_Pa07g1935 [Persea americana]
MRWCGTPTESIGQITPSASINIQGRRLLSKVLAMIKGAKEFVAPFRKPIKGAFKVGKAVTCKEYCPPNVNKNTCIVCPNN